MEFQSASPPRQGEAKKPRAITMVKFILHQWLLAGFCVACLLAYFFPEVAKHGGIIRAEYSILYGAVAAIFFLSGLSIPKDKLLKHTMNFRLHLHVQGVSFLIIPAIMCGLINLIDATDYGEKIDKAVLAGYIVVACLPTTIASNVVMTRAAGGDDAAALVEVFVANVMGPFITPGWAVTLLPKSAKYDVWRESNGDLQEMYRSVFKGLSLSVLLPLVVGQLVRWLWAEKTAWVMQRFKLAKFGSVCLILVVWSSFSTCFSTGALQSLSHETIILVTLINVVFYLFLTCITFILAYPPSAIISRAEPTTITTSTTTRAKLNSLCHSLLTNLIKRTPPPETIAICFCGPAKTTSLGIPMIYAMYSTKTDLQLVSKLSVPVILYTTEQIFCAHFMVYLFRRWGERRAEERDEKEQMDGDDHEGGCESEAASARESTRTAVGMHQGRNGVSDVEGGGKEVVKEVC
ncbi:hypothetical protein AJ79_02428 [Helicocarpus griseus UAMH5409]|uniref:Sodium/bile acid cotransporter 7 n=1 Tax=Helicocarpus griseus UAMH5409 TaxID=1447875 RepID=A0A2B7Y328_9EURO|nr:hypothetical protein AJ79_02428 [Helicocarpus griseus UAMH5409]